MPELSTCNTPYRLNMASQKKPATKRDLSSRLEVNADVDIHKSDCHIRPVSEKPESFRISTSFISNNDSRFPRCNQRHGFGVGIPVFLVYKVWVVCSTQETVGYIVWTLWMTVAGEMGVLIPDSFVSFEVIFPFFVKETQKHRYRLLGSAAPSVIIAIPCCGEDPGIVMDTIIAAASQDCLTHRFRILVLDDKKDAFLE